jgi:MFS family permease
VLEALREPGFRRLWLAGACVSTARWLDLVVLGWVALELTDSPVLVGVAAFCRSAPMLTIGPLAGLLADRVDRGRLMVAVQLVNLAAAAALAALFLAGHGGYATLVVLDTLLGVAWALDFPARRAALYALVGPGRVTNAISLEGVSVQGTKMLGPVLGGVLLARAGPAGCYLALTVLYIGALALIAGLARRVAFPAGGRPGPIVTDLAAGLREARARAPIRAVLLVTVVMNVLVFPYQAILAVFARDVLAVGPEGLGLLNAAEGVGLLAGSLLIAGWRGLAAHGLVFGVGSLLTAALVAAFALSPWYALSLAVQVAIGFVSTGFGTMQTTIVLLSAPEAVRGRVLGILSACIGTQPFGALWIGLAAGLVGAPAAAAAGAVLAAVLMTRVARRLWSLDVGSAHASGPASSTG